MIYYIVWFITWVVIVMLATAAWFGWYEFLKWVVS